MLDFKVLHKKYLHKIVYNNLYFTGGDEMSKKIKLGREKIKNKIDFIGKNADIPSDPFGKNAHIILHDNNELIIDGCYGIMEYSENSIKINIGNKALLIKGTEFDISDYTSLSICIKGEIISLEFC